MISASCPSCGKALVLRLLPDYGSWAWCRSCGRPIGTDNLLRLGIPKELITQLDDWAFRSPKMVGVGIEGDFGPGWDDHGYVTAWKELRDETMQLMSKLRGFLETNADVVAEVYDTRKAEEWTDNEIVLWRRHQYRLRLVQEYGGLLGAYFVDVGNPVPKDSDPLPIPCPGELSREDEQSRFRAGFYLGTRFGPAIGIGYDRWEKNVVRLEEQLGIRPTKKPSGGAGPPEGVGVDPGPR